MPRGDGGACPRGNGGGQGAGCGDDVRELGASAWPCTVQAIPVCLLDGELAAGPPHSGCSVSERWVILSVRVCGERCQALHCSLPILSACPSSQCAEK